MRGVAKPKLKKERKPVRTLSAGLLLEGKEHLDLLLEDIADWKREPVKVKGKVVGTLHVRPAVVAPPRWAKLFAEADVNPVVSAKTRSEGALLLLEVEGRTCVVPFGNAHAKIPEDILEPRFGRIVSLNLLDPKRVRAADTLRLDGANRNSRTQVARPATFLEFGIDGALDLVRAIRGDCADRSVARRAGGSRMLQFAAEMKLGELRAKLGELVEKFDSDDYKAKFRFIDQLEHIRDAALKSTLNDALIEIINEDHEGRAWMAVPDIIEWETFSAFVLRNVPTPSDELDDLFVPDLLDAFGGAIGDVDQLKRGRVEMRRDDDARRTWSIYRCLYAEIEHDGRRYILNDGHWYNIAADLLAVVDATFASLHAPKLKIPAWSEGTHESDYNEALVDANKGAVLGDKKLVSIATGVSPIEVCDMLRKDGALVHVKKYGGSDVLSYLFAQGVVSAESLTDEHFRASAGEKLDTDLLDGVWDPQQHPVIYLIGAKSPDPLRLPFFSRLTLHYAVRRLRMLRHDVQLGTALIG